MSNISEILQNINNALETLPEEINKFTENHNDAKHFLFINGYISNDLFLRLHKEIKNKKNEKEDIYVVVNSFGGDPDAAYKILKYVRASFNKVYGIIPLYASSAATLISLGFDTIYFSSLGEMSPLDVQISKKSEGDKPVNQSALDHMSSIREIMKIAFATYEKHYNNIPDYLKEMDKIKLASDYANKLIAPLLNQVNPIELGNVARTNAIALDYGKRILSRYKGWEEERSETFMEKVVHYYPSHSSIIDEQELKNLGFEDVETKDYLDIDFDIFNKLLVIDYIKYYSFSKKKDKVSNKHLDSEN